jgi:hypothetical protein
MLILILELLCRYETTGWLKLFLDTVRRMSPAVFLHMRLWSGRDEVTAEKSNVKSFLRESSSTAGTKAQSRIKIYEKNQISS